MSKDFKSTKYKPVTIGGLYPGKTIGAAGISSIFGPDVTDGLANIAEAVLSFQHVPSGKDVYFKAFITTFADSYSPDYGIETVFGRTDPIYTFKNTTRNITLSWKIPAETISEAYENLQRAQTLAQFLYPNYGNIGNALTLTQTPLVRLKVMNLVSKIGLQTKDEAAAATGDLKKYRSSKDSNKGLLGVIKSVTINHNLENFEAGVVSLGPNTILPKLIDVNISFDVIHEKTLGWEGSSFKAKGFPYNVVDQSWLDSDELMAHVGDNAHTGRTISDRIEHLNKTAKEEAGAEQDRANALARYGSAFGNARFKKDAARLAKLEGKKNQSAADKANIDYLASAMRGQKGIRFDEWNAARAAAEMQ